jgi:hypothetical protein
LVLVLQGLLQEFTLNEQGYTPFFWRAISQEAFSDMRIWLRIILVFRMVLLEKH